MHRALGGWEKQPLELIQRMRLQRAAAMKTADNKSARNKLRPKRGKKRR